MKRFNVTGICYPDKHYMVDIHERLEIIAQMVERGDYFCNEVSGCIQSGF